MKLKTFEKKEKIITKHYRAVCYDKKGHWKEKWRSSYTEAYNDGERHTNSSNNAFHDVRIEKRVYSEAKIG